MLLTSRAERDGRVLENSSTLASDLRTKLRFVSLLSLLIVVACDGKATRVFDAPPVVEDGEEDAFQCVATPGVLPSPLNRLTRDQYDNTVKDLFGDDSRPARAFPADEQIAGFDRGINASALLAETELYAAEQVAMSATARKDALFPCDWAAAADTCAGRFIREFGPRVMRRPLSAGEVSALDALYAAWKPDGTDAAVSLVIEAMMMSPEFLYHVETDASRPKATGQVELSDHELANRLSYFLWNSAPDEPLRAAADEGALRTDEEVHAQTARLLSDPRARDAELNYFRQWLQLDKLSGMTRDATLYASFTPAHAADLRTSIDLQLRDYYDSGATVSDLLAGNALHVNERLASYYGFSGANASGFTRVTTPDAYAAGILAHPGLVALLSRPDKSDPIHRGLFVRTQLLCDDIPPPPSDVVLNIEAASPEATTREKFAQHTKSAACAACHLRIDPIGFGFEGMDATGKLRSEEFGRPVDTSGEVLFTQDSDGVFHGVHELGQKLKDSQQVRRCVVARMFSYAVGQQVHPKSCVNDALTADITASGDKLNQISAHVVQSPFFRTRMLAAEVSP